MKRTNIYLTDKQYKELGAISKRTGASVAEIVRRSIDLYLDSRGKQTTTWNAFAANTAQRPIGGMTLEELRKALFSGKQEKHEK